MTASRTVDWWAVHTFVLPLLTEVGCWPMAGTIAWLELDADHPAKRAAIYDFGRHHALRVDTGQVALAEASHAIAGAADWSALSRNTLQRNGVYIPREVA